MHTYERGTFSASLRRLYGYFRSKWEMTIATVGCKSCVQCVLIKLCIQNGAAAHSTTPKKMERNWDFRVFFSLSLSLLFREKLYTVKTCIQKHFIECKLQAMILCFIKTQRRRWATTPKQQRRRRRPSGNCCACTWYLQIVCICNGNYMHGVARNCKNYRHHRWLAYTPSNTKRARVQQRFHEIQTKIVSMYR